MTTKRKHVAKPKDTEVVDPGLFEMKAPVSLDEPFPVQTRAQERSLGLQLVQALSEGRAFELRAVETGSVLLLVSAADDLGHVYLIDCVGAVRDVGRTEKV